MPSDSYNISPTGGANVAQVLQGKFREMFLVHPNMQVFRYDNTSGTYKDQNGNVGQYTLTHNYKDIPINFYNTSDACGVIDAELLNSGYLLYGRVSDYYVVIDKVNLTTNTSFGRDDRGGYYGSPRDPGYALTYNYKLHQDATKIYFLFDSHFLYYSQGTTQYVVASFDTTNNQTAIINSSLDYNTATSKKTPVSKLFQVKSGTKIYNCLLTVHETTKQVYLDVIIFDTSNNSVTTSLSNPVTLPTSVANKLTSENYYGMIHATDPRGAVQNNPVSMYFGKNIKVKNPDNNLNFSGYLYFGTAYNTYDRKILRVPFSFTLNTTTPGSSTFAFQAEKEFYFSIKRTSANKYYYKNNSTGEEIFTHSPVTLSGYTLVSQVDKVLLPTVYQYSIEIQDDIDADNFTAFVHKNATFRGSGHRKYFLSFEKFTSTNYSKIVSSIPIGSGRAVSSFFTSEKVSLDRAYEQANNQFSLFITFGLNYTGDNTDSHLLLYSLNSLPYNYTVPTSSTDYINVSKEPYYVKWTDPDINYYTYDQTLSTTAGVPVYKNNHAVYFNTYTAVNAPSTGLITPVVTFLVPGDGVILPANTIISHYTYIDDFSTLPSRYQYAPYSHFTYNIGLNSTSQSNGTVVDLYSSNFQLSASFIVKFVRSTDTKNISLHGIQGSTDVWISTLGIVPVTYKSLYHYYQDKYANIAVFMFNGAKFDLDSLFYAGSNYAWDHNTTNYDKNVPRSYITFTLVPHIFVANLRNTSATNLYFDESTNTVTSVLLKHDLNNNNFAPALYTPVQKDTSFMSRGESLAISAKDPKQVGLVVNLGENLRCGDVVILTQNGVNYYYEIIATKQLSLIQYDTYYYAPNTTDQSVYFLMLYNIQ